jgi:hypothetical protein
VPSPAERDVETFVAQSLAREPIADADLAQKVHCVLFEDARADALDDMLLAADFDDDRVDAGQVQQVAEQEPGRAGADDADGHACVRHEMTRADYHTRVGPSD